MSPITIRLRLALCGLAACSAGHEEPAPAAASAPAAARAPALAPPTLEPRAAAPAVVRVPFDDRDPTGGPESVALVGERLWVARPFRNHVIPVVGQTVGAPVAVDPTPIAVIGDGPFVWVASLNGGTVSKIDSAASRVVARVTVGAEPGGLALDGGFLWVTNRVSDTVSKVATAEGRVVATFATGKRPIGVAPAFGSLWVVNNKGDSLSRIDPASGETRGTSPTGDGPFGIAVTADAVWVTNFFEGTVSSFRSDGGPRSTHAVGNGPAGIVFDGTSLWITLNGDNRIARVDPASGQVMARFDIDQSPYGLLLTPDRRLVAANSGSDSISILSGAAAAPR